MNTLPSQSNFNEEFSHTIPLNGGSGRHEFMGCPIDSYFFEDAVDDIEKRIKEKKMTNIIHFLNVAKIVKCRHDKRLLNVLRDGDFVLADGKPLVFLGSKIGVNIPERVNGTDLMMRLLSLCNEKGYRVYLLGAKQDVLESCLDKIRESYPKIKIAGYRNGYFNKTEADDVIRKINSASPDVLFIGMPTPRKEFFAYENRNNLDVPIIQGVGGSFDVVAGLVNRAPRWMQIWGLEWLYRVIQEPRRMLWRYLSTNTIFLLRYAWHFGAYQYQTKVQQTLRKIKLTR